MNTPIERLQTALEALGLKAVQARLENLLEQASKKEPSYADFLDELLSCEVEARRTRYLRARLQLAHLPFVKTFEQFDFGFQPSLDERQIRELRSLRFIHEASNVILLGPPGVGKTHLSVALAEEAIRSGMAAYFITAHDLAADLGRAYREGRLDRRMRVYLAPKVLVIDEVGYLPLDDLGATIFFQLVSARYERGSIILTSNKSYGDWGSIFGDSIIATAILDRLLHHSTTINIRGESYRLKDRRKAGLVPPRGQEGAEAAARSWPRTPLRPKRAKRRRWAPLRPRPGRPIHEVQGWGIFNRYKGEFSTGIDKSTGSSSQARLLAPGERVRLDSIRVWSSRQSPRWAQLIQPFWGKRIPL